MQWTEITVKVPVSGLETASAIAGMTVPYGLYIEDYSDMEKMLPSIGWVDAIDETLLACDRQTAVIHVYIHQTAHPGEAISFMAERLAAEGIEHQIATAEIKEEDWADSWKQYYKPERVGRRLIIRPSWEIYSPQEDDIVLDLDPGAAFGTGQHETTRLCLELIEQYMQPGARVLDMGCGSGILSIAALKLGAAWAMAVDIDQNAANTAVRNAKINGFDAETFTALAGNVTENQELDQAVGAGYDLILANIVADVIIAMRALFFQKLRPGGQLIVSGIIDARADETAQALCDAGFTVEERREKRGWVALRLTKPNG